MIILEILGGLAVAALIGLGAMYAVGWFQRAVAAQHGEQSVNSESSAMGNAQPGEPSKTV